MAKDSIFTKIVKGEIPAYKIYEDEHILAFLDIYPVQPGHVLVIPKKQIEFVWDLSDDDYSRLMKVSRKLALEMRERLKVPYIHLGIVGTDVPHAHIHLIPFTSSDHLRVKPDASKGPDHQALGEMAKRLTLL